MAGEANKGPHQGEALRVAGRPLADARGALILLHGRGATAESILELADFWRSRPWPMWLRRQPASRGIPIAFCRRWR